MNRNFRFQQGATLIEALVAVLIFSIGILAVIGIQALAVQVTADAKYRADASFIANQALGRIWGDPTNLASFAEDHVSIDDLPNGKRTVEINGDRVTVTVNWQQPGETTERQYIVSGYINVD